MFWFVVDLGRGVEWCYHRVALYIAVKIEFVGGAQLLGAFTAENPFRGQQYLDSV